MNTVNIIGRLTADPELKATQSGKNVCQVTVAVYRTKEKTDFLPCIAWEESAKLLAQYFKKGSMVGITGELQSRNYETKDKQKRTAIEVVIRSVSFCGEGNKKSEEAKEIPKEPDFAALGNEEDLPF